MGQIMQKQIGQIGQKANWANCFFQCVQGMLRIISIIYNNKYMCIHENAQFAFAQFAQFAH